MSCTCELTEVGPNNDYLILITGLVDNNDTELNSATVTYQIYDADNTIIVGANGTITALGTGGNYSGVVDKTIINLLTVGLEYIVRVTGEQGGADFEIDLPIIDKRRTP